MSSILTIVAFAAIGVVSAAAQTTPPLSLTRTIALPGITGKFDHFAIDLDGHRLFAAATGNHSVEVIDLLTGKIEQSIRGLGKPHGLAWVAATHSLYVADGTLKELGVYQGSPLALKSKLNLSDDADDMVYDPMAHTLYVGHGGSDAANPARIAVVDTDGFALKANIPVATHPEALDIDEGNQRIFANIAESGEVVVIDGKAARGSGNATYGIAARWKLSRASDNVPLAYDAERNALFVACRTPARLIALDAASGKEISSVATGAGADDLFYDAVLKYAYVISGAGEVDVYRVDGQLMLHAIGVVHTAVGAKTALFVPSQSALYVGIPGMDGHGGEIRVYQTSATRGLK